MIRAMNLARLGEESVERFGEYVSLAFEDREYTNVEQQRAASRLAHALTRLGVAEGERVVVITSEASRKPRSWVGATR